jgi:hypothetical protein
MASQTKGVGTALQAASKVYLDGREIQFTAYNIEGNN